MRCSKRHKIEPWIDQRTVIDPSYVNSQFIGGITLPCADSDIDGGSGGNDHRIGVESLLN